MKYLMHPVTGYVQTESEWLSEMNTWFTERETAQEQFDKLIEVEKNLDYKEDEDNSPEWIKV